MLRQLIASITVACCGLVALACGSNTTDSSSGSSGSSGSTPPPVLASDYSKACTADNDCVAVAASHAICAPCGQPCGGDDAIDALAIARFAAQKRPAVTTLPDAATIELRELVRLRDRWVQELGDHVRQLHRLVDLGFPEFTRHVKALDSVLATEILTHYPTAAAVKSARVGDLANLRYDGRHAVGRELAKALDIAREEASRALTAL